jgi:hypothetical protein
VIDGAVGSGHPEIYAHELGHYLSLDHVSDAKNVMAERVAPDSLGVTREQCLAAREAVRTYWSRMLR